MMFSFSRRKKANFNMNITPLIDVVFLLLLFFMLTSQFVKKPGIEISLPVSKSAVFQKDNDIQIYIAKSNQLFFNNRKVSIKQLEKKLRNQLRNQGKFQADSQKNIEDSKKQNAGKIVRITAQKDISIQTVIHVMDIVRQTQASSIILTTQKVGSEQ